MSNLGEKLKKAATIGTIGLGGLGLLGTGCSKKEDPFTSRELYTMHVAIENNYEWDVPEDLKPIRVEDVEYHPYDTLGYKRAIFRKGEVGSPDALYIHIVYKGNLAWEEGKVE